MTVARFEWKILTPETLQPNEEPLVLNYQPGPRRPLRIVYAYSYTTKTDRIPIRPRLSNLSTEYPQLSRKHSCNRCNMHNQWMR